MVARYPETPHSSLLQHRRLHVLTMPPPHLTPSLIAAQSRFISESKARIGKCVTFGCSTSKQLAELSFVLRQVTWNWRRYVVGREGYITNKDDVGLFRQKVAWGDHDQMGHVNNVRYNFWAETARINWARNIALRADPAHRKQWEELWTPRGIGLILRSIKTDYKFPLRYPDRITVCHKLMKQPTEGMDALHLEAVVLSETHQRVAARITEDIVVYDYRTGKKTPLPSFMVETLSQLWSQQERTIEAAMSDIYGLQRLIKKIEKQTWDRHDAVEDLGSAMGSPEALNENTQGKDVTPDVGSSFGAGTEERGQM
ncbi:uncharacterized protein PV09_05951 [Verruconis gallopava]|uniref:Thioesterase domain-containing protein n=1 Tax=Verruconis gallopava TaxID=253628 RepID=A0A0D2A820_9PEZI|nr:uncharacterized protein PV09_05951 [Verruconis gallopava]KIW02903.1 hypothetical protein PV09_05951 [Verruconis gallopava]